MSPTGQDLEESVNEDTEDDTDDDEEDVDDLTCDVEDLESHESVIVGGSPLLHRAVVLVIPEKY